MKDVVIKERDTSLYLVNPLPSEELKARSSHSNRRLLLCSSILRTILSCKHRQADRHIEQQHAFVIDRMAKDAAGKFRRKGSKNAANLTLSTHRESV